MINKRLRYNFRDCISNKNINVPINVDSSDEFARTSILDDLLKEHEELEMKEKMLSEFQGENLKRIKNEKNKINKTQDHIQILKERRVSVPISLFFIIHVLKTA